jgi:hypothetical protein
LYVVVESVAWLPLTVDPEIAIKWPALPPPQVGAAPLLGVGDA